MATNKKKRAVATKKPKADSKEDAVEVDNNPAAEKPPALTGSQLSALIFLAIGASKVMELSSAYKQGIEDPVLCMSYLKDEETCKHPSFPSLILAKYHSSIDLSLLVSIVVMVVWKTETYFSKLMTCLCISPVSTTVLGIAMSQGDLTQSRAVHMMLICFVLLASSVPNSKEKLPFITNTPWETKSLQAICLMTLIATTLMDVFRLSSGDAGRENSLLQTPFPFPPKAVILVNFWCIDKMTMALLYFYALVHFPEPIQRRFLCLVFFLKLWEGLYQLTTMPDPFESVGTVQSVILGTAVFSAIAWLAPSLKVKQKES
eukprot:scaffold4157_cov136-Cylindrotheca_fusiformis.AAC.36